MRENKVLAIAFVVGCIGVAALVYYRLTAFAFPLVAGMAITVIAVVYRRHLTRVHFSVTVATATTLVVGTAWLLPQAAVESALFGILMCSFIIVRVSRLLGFLAFMAIAVGSAVPIFSSTPHYPVYMTVAVLGAALVYMLQLTEIARKFAEYRRLSIYDDLTKLHNMRYFRYKVQKHFADPRVKRLVLCLLDLDRFKSVNDALGHREGDVVLQKVARVIEAAARPAVVSRYGGEEFVILLPNYALDEAQRIAENIRHAVEHATVCSIPITMSCGLAQVDTHASDPEKLFDTADRALYLAKETRNRVVIYIDEASAEAEVASTVRS